MRNLDELNINQGGRPVKRKPAAEPLLIELEAQLGATLPVEYKGLLRFSNGGHPELDTVLVDVKGRELMWNVNTFYYLQRPAYNTNDTENLFWIHSHYKSVLGPRCLAFADNGGGDIFFLDLNAAPAPVKIWLHDSSSNGTVEIVAPTFAWFINSLGLNPEYI